MATLLRRKRKKRNGNGFKQGEYEVINKEKYLGTKNPRFLSSYELECFRRADLHPHILEWGSETVIVPYFNPVKERKCRYIVDLYMKYQNRHGEIIEEIIEIKPYAQTKMPQKTSRKRVDVYEREFQTYAQNMAKWQAASEYAKKRGWHFRIITEKNIFA